jgi:hypothetical protein
VVADDAGALKDRPKAGGAILWGGESRESVWPPNGGAGLEAGEWEKRVRWGEHIPAQAGSHPRPSPLRPCISPATH